MHANEIDVLGETVRPDTTLQRDPIGQRLEAAATVFTQARGELHLSVRLTDEIQDTGASEFERTLPQPLAVVVSLRAHLICEIDPFDLRPDLGEDCRQLTIVVVRWRAFPLLDQTLPFGLIRAAMWRVVFARSEPLCAGFLALRLEDDPGLRTARATDMELEATASECRPQPCDLLVVRAEVAEFAAYRGEFVAQD